MTRNIVSVILVVDTGIMSTDDSVCLSNFSFFAFSLLPLSLSRATHIKISRKIVLSIVFQRWRGGGLRGIQGVSRLYKKKFMSQFEMPILFLISNLKELGFPPVPTHMVTVSMSYACISIVCERALF